MQNIDESIDQPREAAIEPALAERLSQIRGRLPGQVLWDRIDTARAAYGPLYTAAEVEQRIGETLPARPGCRSAVFEPIETYRGSRIPDAALLKYDEAVRTGLFNQLWVATPTYRAEQQVDSWLLGEVAGADRYVVIARWG
jgi:hypothetical protein